VAADQQAEFLEGKSVLVTGGTGSFGRAFVASLLADSGAPRVVVFSRDELKQWEMQQQYRNEPRLRFFIGDVRDGMRLRRAFSGIDVVVHAAALKQIPATEYNPFEAVRTNIHGAENVINAAIDEGVTQVLGLSTDKASSPINLYGATKLVSDKLFVAGNAYAGGKRTRMAVVRYGNVFGSRGSVVSHFRSLAPKGKLPITDGRMTRFWITLQQAVHWVRESLVRMHGGEIFVPKLPSMKIVDLARAVAPDAELEVVGIRPGEKLHEEMISVESARNALDMGDYYVIQPDVDWWLHGQLDGKRLPDGFSYASNTNTDWLDARQLHEIVATL
jgi:UDP-N-acetylglucosamine 4,6-dehydratase